MQYILTGVVVLIISGLAINLLSVVIESLYKTFLNRTTSR
ncbi:hypothetical protein [Klebsiella aerogenes]|nr:hypothetical protein [Klebsiella aerogenes]KLF75174.1 phosphatidate cytidylyltransferase [Klebsiella aerogenes]